MKKLLLLFVLLSAPAFADIPATSQWDVRTTGNDTNGGCFDPSVASPGTDYSQQNAAQITFSDLVIGGTTTQLTSAGNPFSSLSPGNCINITGGTGFTVGRYEVISVSGSTATMDRAVGTAASTGGAGKLGGSFATLQAIVTASSVHTVSDGSLFTNINIKAGTYTLTSSLSIAPSNSVRLSLWGYQTTHFDGGTKPLITTATNSTDLIQVNFSLPIKFVNLSLSNTATTRAIGIASVGGTYPVLYVQDSLFDGFTYHMKGDNSGNTATYAYLVGSEFKNSTVAGVTFWWDVIVQGCYFHGNTGVNITKTSNQAAMLKVTDTIISGGTKGIVGAANTPFTFIDGNTIFGQSGDGVEPGTAAGGAIPNTFTNNIIYGVGGIGLNVVATTPAAQGIFVNRNNAYGSNTGGNYNASWPAGKNDVTLTANPFTNSGSGDFSLNSTAGGGAAARSVGFPSFTGSTTTATPNIGAVQGNSGATTTGSNYGQSN